MLTDGTADVFGADGATTTVPAGGVIGVAGGQRHLDAGVRRGRGCRIAGSFGVLTLNADGSYSYDGNPNVVPPAGATDMFVYTITDGDGDTSTTTLTINLTDSGARCAGRQRRDGERERARHHGAAGRPDLAAGTVTGSLPGSAAETDATNQLNGSGGTAPLSYALQTGGNAATAGLFGTIQVNTRRHLHLHADQPVRHHAGRRQRRQHGGGGELQLCGDGRQRQHRDRHHHGQHRRRRSDGECEHRQRVEGAIVTGNVLTDGTADVFGADGARDGAGGGVTGVAAGSDTSTPVCWRGRESRLRAASAC